MFHSNGGYVTDPLSVILMVRLIFFLSVLCYVSVCCSMSFLVTLYIVGLSRAVHFVLLWSIVLISSNGL